MNFKKIIEFNASIGLTYDEILSLDQGTIMSIQRGFIIKREREMNDTQILNIRLAAKVAQAVWNDRHFKDIKPIELKKDEDEKTVDQIVKERNNKVFTTLKRLGVMK